MPSAFRYQTVARWIAMATLAASAMLAVHFTRIYRRPVIAVEGPSSNPTVRAPLSVAVATGDVWNVMQSRSEKNSARPSQAAPERLRLAGTFSLEGAGEIQRKAIIDDTVKRDQFIVGEGDRLDESMVEKIFADHVVLRTPSGTRELWVEFGAKGAAAQTAAQGVTTNKVTAQSGSTNKFGCAQTQENRWTFKRKPILDYYQELLDEPDRMVAVFDTMKPVRDEQNKITGYVVGLEGEKDFFSAVGLQQGDIVRAVNSFPMTNRRRAEAFIDQFLKNSMNVVVLDVERGGQTVKQVYQLQP